MGDVDQMEENNDRAEREDNQYNEHRCRDSRQLNSRYHGSRRKECKESSGEKKDGRLGSVAKECV